VDLIALTRHDAPERVIEVETDVLSYHHYHVDLILLETEALTTIDIISGNKSIIVHFHWMVPWMSIAVSHEG
jgi:hypothetical protein